MGGAGGITAQGAGGAGTGPAGAPGRADTAAGSGGAGGVAGGGTGGLDAAAGGGSAAGGTGGDAGSEASACSGKSGKLRGRSVQRVMAGGLQRSFVYYAPQSLDPNKPAPLVILPHGYILDGAAMFDITRYSELADKENFVAIFPDGVNTTWSFGGSECRSTALGILPDSGVDDQAFVDAMIEFASADQCIDREHMFVTGWSMGGYFSNEIGCLRSDIRAIAPHSGGSHDLSKCPQMRKPVLIMHFEPDGLIPYRCGVETRDRWVERNGCQATSPEIKMVNGGSCEYYKGCPADAQVAFCTFAIPPGIRTELIDGHAWSGGSKGGLGADFAIPETESATQMTWDFFKQYAW